MFVLAGVPPLNKSVALCYQDLKRKDELAASFLVSPGLHEFLKGYVQTEIRGSTSAELSPKAFDSDRSNEVKLS